MPIKVLMPALSPTMTEGTLAKWVKNEGDSVESGEVIVEIETDKATMEVEAVDDGVLAKILVPGGTAHVAVNKMIAVLLEEDEDEGALKSFLADNDSQNNDTEAPNNVAKDKQVVSSDKSEPQKGYGNDMKAASQEKEQPPVSGKRGRVFSSPLARRLAAQKGVDLAGVKGSGPKGRIVKNDIEAAQVGSAAPQTAAASSGATPQPKGDQQVNEFGMLYTETPNNNIKKITAQRLTESKQTVPHFYLTISCRIDELLRTRKTMNDQADGAYKLSVNDFIVKAVAQALKAYPAANVSWTDEAVRQYVHSDISVAVSTPNGLITPIVKQAEQKGLQAISSEVKDLAGRARDGKLKPEEFQGGTFTVSNLGMFGIEEFGAIINPPQACILAVGAGERKPYADGNDVKIGTFMKCTLSVDHRAVDGAVGAEFLQVFKRYIETPAAMLL